MRKKRSFFEQIKTQIEQKWNAPQYHELKLLLEAFDQQNESAADILYFGDSVLQRISRDDKDIKTLSEMVARRLEPVYKTCILAHSAYTPRIFLALSQVFKIMRNCPKLVILPINIRAFSPQWDCRPHWQFEREILALRKFCKSPSHGIPRFIPSDQLPVSRRKISNYAC